MPHPDMKRRVLLIIYNAAHFRELFRLAKMLISSGLYVPMILFVSPYPTLGEHYQCCLDYGINTWVRGQPLVPRKRAWWTTPLLLPSLLVNAVRFMARWALPTFLRKLLMGSVAKVRKRLLLIWIQIADHLRETKLRFLERLRASDLVLVHLIRAYKQLRYCRHVCKILRPDLVVLAEDNVEYISGAWVRAAHFLQIPVLIVPYCLAGAEEPAAVYLHDARHHADAQKNRSLARLYPHWVYEYQGRRLVRLPASRALPLEWLRISSPLPWLMNSTYADAIAVESPFMKNFYQRQGISPSQLVITGTASDDMMYRVLENLHCYRNELYAQYGMLPDRPMLLCALPPITSAMSALREEFLDYQEMIRFWLDSLRKIEGYNIFISLHPTMNYWDFAFLDEGGWWGIAIAPPDTSRMIALCDIYIASVSSTIRWAIACGKPVINYDVYRFRFPDFRPARGVVTVEKKEDFRRVLWRLTSDSRYYQVLQQAQLESRKYWGMIDGKSDERLLALMGRLIAQYQHAPQPSATRKLPYFPRAVFRSKQAA
ncbi:hypothetical protein HRbin36_00556 [bacterium HR36]|nr:hypothetical protein HRbin36_00556 [bacterium HR36]